LSLKRYFVGWDGPLTAKVRDFLLPQPLRDPVSLKEDLIIVPTREAGRRLREALAAYCAEKDTVLLDAAIVPPSCLFLRGGETESEADKAVVSFIWAQVLKEGNPKQFKALFPANPPDREFLWSLHTGKMIQNLRNSIVEGGYLIADVVRKFGDILEERDRWQDLATLETEYLRRIKLRNVEDPCCRKLRLSADPELPSEVKRIVVAGVPDPTLLAIRALEKLSQEIEVVVLVFAPESVAGMFDEWGRPVAEKWQSESIDIPDSGRAIVSAESPAIESKLVIEQIAGGNFGLGDIAIGVPDHSVVSFLKADLDDRGIQVFDPAGKPVTEHPLYQLVQVTRDLLVERSYRAFSAFLRHKDILEHICHGLKLSPQDVLTELDKFQNESLPMTVDDIRETLDKWQRSEKKAKSCANLAKAADFVRSQMELFSNCPAMEGLRSFVQTVYGDRSVSSASPEDREFIACAEKFDSVLHEWDDCQSDQAGATPGDVLEVLLQRLGEERYELQKPDDAIDLEGWLELPWNDAPCMIITGMNEGFVPDSQLSDIFLPDSLRGELRLRSDAQRFGRDVYLLKAMIESRRKSKGHVRIIVGRRSASGDPLKPSRLLFRCSDADLLDRADRLFADAKDVRTNAPPTISVRLNPGLPSGFDKDKLVLKKMSVTAFRDYLVCPFRFYLKHILKMEALNDQKSAMDGAEFGTMIHYALRIMAEDEKIRKSCDEEKIRSLLWSAAERWAHGRFGKSPPLIVDIQLESARKRLAAAASVHADLVKTGWEIIEVEKECTIVLKDMAGFEIHGKIDRIDRHRGTGKIHVLDYKTSDKAEDPKTVHLCRAKDGVRDYASVAIQGKNKPVEKQWIDLQLPLYGMLNSGSLSDSNPCELGYFNLPKAVNETGVEIWEGYDQSLAVSAERCVRGVIQDLQERRFWPPSENVRYDDFETLFPASAEECFDVSDFIGAIEKGVAANEGRKEV